MNSRSVILLHGFGVRSYFWDQVGPLFAKVFETVLTPDLRTDNISTLLDTTKELIRRRTEHDGAPVSLVGHSLGGIVSAIAARDLGPGVVEQIAVIASPFGERRQAPSPVLRFLLKRHLLPGFVVRSRFFSSHT
ncbi:MAG: alpha/beta fold hydrolase, partial [Spirochaetota bacterium]